jgi:HTH-type transcriptional regulator, sugar sensing transcriptional regulator
METADVLKQMGLEEKQANVYLALLELGTASVQGIANKAGIKRPTTYLVLDELEKKGLVSLVPQKKALYTAESPEYLIAELNKRQELLKRFLPDMLALYNAKKEKPQVQLFWGKEGVSQVYAKIFESDQVWFFGNIRGVSKIYPEGLDEFTKRVEKSDVRVRDILTRTPEDEAYAYNVERKGNYETRFLPKELDAPMDSAVAGDRVVFFSFSPQIFCVMITSKEVSRSLKSMYELAWRSAEPMIKQ